MAFGTNLTVDFVSVASFFHFVLSSRLYYFWIKICRHPNPLALWKKKLPPFVCSKERVVLHIMR